ncbi:MAG: lytic transglycosylase domain-containing protein, partial [Pseudomonadota bacterium]
NDWGTFIDRNSDLVDWMSSEQRGRYYKNLGEMAWLRQKNGLAKVNFLRSYAFQKDSKVLRRLERLKATGSLKIDKYSKEFIEAADERKLWNKFSSSVKNGQTNRIAKYGAEFLNAFPGSQRVDSVRDQVNRVYKRLLYRRGERFQLSKQNFENELMKAPPQYLLFWATEAYERGYQKSSFRLAKRAADRWEGTDEAAQALLLAGRSAYYLVDRSSAKSFFTELTEKYSGSLASQEARYYLGLLYYREGDLNKMVKLYDEFLLSRGSDKWELQVRYWLWRALKKNGSRRSEEIGETILKEFPLTYYGLMVRMEDKGNLQSIFKSKDPAISSEAWWPKSLASRVGRIQKLLKSGWVKEAETEIFYLPDPESAAGFVSRAKVWKKAGVFNRSIKDFAEAIDRDHSFLTSGVLKESFPVDHQMDVEKAAKEFSMSPYLIWSIIRQESAFMKEAISPSRAYGLMQLLSPTARETARWLKVKSFRMTRDIFKPEINIRFGSHFLSRMIGKYKSVIPLAVASYNVGPGNLDRWLSHRTDLKNWAEFGASPDDEMWVDELPWAETSFYVKAVMRNYLLYQIIHNQLDRLESPAWKTAKIQTGK